MSETKQEAKRDLILNPQRIGLAEQMRQDWVVNAETGTAIADVIKPSYWAHMAAQFQPYDHIEVRLETGEWVAELIVLSVGRNYAQVYLANKYEFADVDPVNDNLGVTHKVEWKGPQRKHIVVRVADSAAIQEGFSTKQEANAWLANYLRTVEKTA